MADGAGDVNSLSASSRGCKKIGTLNMALNIVYFVICIGILPQVILGRDEIRFTI